MSVTGRKCFQSLPYQGVAFGVAAAILFGLSSPLAKLLLKESDPLLLAALLYLGAGAGLFAFELLLSRFSTTRPLRQETPIRREDLALLFGILLTGGILGPILLLAGLQRLSAVVGSLLLNLEAPFTILLAVGLFRKHLGRREIGAILLIVIGVGFLNYHPGEIRTDWLGVAAIAAACLSWAIDNNLTQRLSLRDPIAIVRAKTLGAGIFTLVLALGLGRRLPNPGILGSALALGFMSYGVSVVLDLYALRMLGAAREAAFFATAPFIGAVAAVPLLGEQWTTTAMVSSVIIATGVLLLLSEHHSHLHLHEETEHDHRHAHTDHHQHAHELPEETLEPHAHAHRHLPLAHDHPHVPELHHRHDH